MKSFEQYKNDLGQRESGNNYKSKNGIGYYGRYQFGRARLADFGFTGNINDFLNNPQLQEDIFLKHVADHAKHLIQVLPTAKKKFSYITLSGLIAGAHLGGRGGVSKFLAGSDFADANGTKVSSYIKQFSGYDIPGYNETGSTNTNEDNTGGGIAKSATKIASDVLTGGNLGIIPMILIAGAISGIIYYYYKS